MANNLILKFRNLPDAEVHSIMYSLHKVISDINVDLESIAVFRRCYLAVMSSKHKHRLVRSICEQLKNVLLSGTSRSNSVNTLLCLILREASPSPHIFIDYSNLPLDWGVMVHILNISIVQSADKLGCSQLNQLIRLVTSTSIPYPAAVRLLATLGNIASSNLTPLHTMTDEVNVLNQHLSTCLISPLSKDKQTIAIKEQQLTEIDGSAMSDSVFTPLILGQYYVGDNFLSVQSFSMLYAWLRWICTHREQGHLQGLDMQTLLSTSLTYTNRVIEQCLGRKAKNVTHDTNLMATCLVECVRLLDVLCDLDGTAAVACLESLKRVYTHISEDEMNSKQFAPVFLALIQYLLHHEKKVVYDASNMYDQYFTTSISRCHDDPLAAYATVHFLSSNLATLCGHTSLLTSYFPNIFKIIAWHPLTFISEFIRIIPAMLTTTTLLEVVHSLLDLPCLTAVLLRVKADEAAAAQATAGGTTRLMFNYMMRETSGQGDTLDMLPQLHSVLSDMRENVRVVECSKTSLVLLEAALHHTITCANESVILQLVPLLLDRVNIIYSTSQYYQGVKSLFTSTIRHIISHYPKALVLEREEILEYVSVLKHAEDNDHFYTTVLHLIGDYLSTEYQAAPVSPLTHLISLYYDYLEIVAYELSSVVSRRPHICHQHHISTLTMLCSSLAKLSSRCEQVTGRAMLCLSKTSQQVEAGWVRPTRKQKSNCSCPHPISHEDITSLTNRTTELCNLLKLPDLASVVLTPCDTLNSGSLHRDPLTSPAILNTLLHYTFNAQSKTEEIVEV